MPIYCYKLKLEDEDCKICGGAFELQRPLSRPDLEQCPLCKKEVRKCISSVNTPRVMKPMQPSEAKAAGFKIYEKRDKGVYEQV